MLAIAAMGGCRILLMPRHEGQGEGEKLTVYLICSPTSKIVVSWLMLISQPFANMLESHITRVVRHRKAWIHLESGRSLLHAPENWGFSLLVFHLRGRLCKRLGTRSRQTSSGVNRSFSKASSRNAIATICRIGQYVSW